MSWLTYKRVYYKDIGETGYRRRIESMPVWFYLLCASLAAGIVVLFIYAIAAASGPDPKASCHAKGPQYHWWSDRERCVLYVD